MEAISTYLKINQLPPTTRANSTQTLDKGTIKARGERDKTLIERGTIRTVR